MYGGEIENGPANEGCGAPFAQNPGNDTWIFSRIGEQWNEVYPKGDLPPPLKRVQAVTVVPFLVYMFSGYSFSCPGTGQVLNNDVYKLTLGFG